MKLNIAICDDDNTMTSFLSSTILQYQVANNTDFQVDIFQNGKDLLERFQKPGDYHVVLLDIEMPVLNGIQVANVIKNMRDRNVLIVFISNYPKYMQDSFSVHPYHFLQKPITSQRIYQLLDEIVKHMLECHTLYTLINTEDVSETINIKDILYIETLDAKKKSLCFHFFNRTIITKGILSYWEQELSNYHFYPCHRGLLVNLFHIHYFESHNIILDNGEKVPMSRALEKKLRELYLNHVIVLKS